MVIQRRNENLGITMTVMRTREYNMTRDNLGGNMSFGYTRKAAGGTSSNKKKIIKKT